MLRRPPLGRGLINQPPTGLLRKYTEVVERYSKANFEEYLLYAALVDILVASYSNKGYQGLHRGQ